MPPIVPTTQDGLLDWYSQHAPVWTVAAASIGLLPAQTTALSDLVTAAKTARDNRLNAAQAAKTATVAYNAALSNLGTFGAAMMATIRAYAEATDDEGVYQKADIPPPAKPTPAGPPVTPTEFTADPNADGTITLKWKGSVAQNGGFDLERSIDGGAYTAIKSTRSKTYLDKAIPMNSAMIVYRIYGTRDDVRNENPATTQVLFGTLPPELQAAFRSGPAAEAA